MRKRAPFGIVHEQGPPPPPDRFNVETKGLRAGAGWFHIVGVPDDQPKTVRKALRAQGWQDETIDRREWRVIPL